MSRPRAYLASLIFSLLLAAICGQGLAVPEGGIDNAFASQRTPVARLLWGLGRDRLILYGRMPKYLAVLDLTDEQMEKIQAICEQAREARDAAAERLPLGRIREGEVYNEVYLENQEKLERAKKRILTRSKTRIRGVLTDEQKATLAEIKEFSAARRNGEDVEETATQRLDRILTERGKRKLRRLFKERSREEALLDMLEGVEDSPAAEEE